MSRRKNGATGVTEKVIENRAKALELRKSGMSYAQIGEQLGVSDKRAFQYIKESLEKLTALETTTANELRTLEAERLDAIQAGLFETAKNGNLWAVDRYLKLAERRAKLLGLDAPIKNEITGSDGGKVEVVVTYVVQESPE